MKLLFIWSKWLHKYVGLCFLLFFLFSAFTGILINHPSLLTRWSVPAKWLGQSYQYSNWNRFSFRDSLLLTDGSMFIGGKMGVFFSPHSDSPFQEYNTGLPDSFYLLDTNALLAVEHGGAQRLFAGGRSGLYFRDSDSKSWQKIASTGMHEIVDLVLSGDRILAFGSHECFAAPVAQDNPVFKQLHLAIDTEGKRVPGYRLLFELHSGKILGLPGRLLVDFSALLLSFLSVSAFYIWYVPLRRRRVKRSKKSNNWFSFFYSYHLTCGIWIGIMLFMIGGSGALVRPPLIVFSSYWQVPFSWLAQKTPEILKAAVTDDNSLVIATRDGWYKGDLSLGAPLQSILPPLPVFGMGATVLEPLSNNRLLIGSFSGLYKWNPKEASAVDIEGNIAVDTGQVQPGEVMAAGAIVYDGEFEGYADYKKGLLGPDNRVIADRSFPADRVDKRLSLYHFLFELHNGRFLRDVIGSFYILYVPLLGMALMLIIFTGTFDWLKRKITRFKRRQKKAGK